MNVEIQIAINSALIVVNLILMAFNWRLLVRVKLQNQIGRQLLNRQSRGF